MKEKRLFWIHISGNGVKNKSISSKTLVKYLREFDKLIRRVAKYKGHVSNQFRESSFDTYFEQIREGCVAIGVRMHPQAYNLPLNPPLKTQESKDEHGDLEEKKPNKGIIKDIVKDPYDETIKDVCNALSHIHKKEGKTFFITEYPKVDNRVAILDTLHKLCPPISQEIKITLTGRDEPFENSEFAEKITHEDKQKISNWINSEQTNVIPTIEGYYIGFKDQRNIFWIVNKDNQEIRCEYDSESFSHQINNLRLYEHIEVKGTFINIPGKSMKIEDVIKITSIDKILEDSIDDEFELNPDNFLPEFRDQFEKTLKDVEQGKFYSEEEFNTLISKIDEKD